MPGKRGTGRPLCRGTTAAGQPCKAKAVAGSAYCPTHGGARRRIGRPTKLTDDVEDALVTAVRTGATLELAAQAAGINVGTLHRWRDQGEDDLDARRDTAFARLSDRLTRAAAEGEVSLVRMVRGAGLVDWRAAAWLLERRHPQRWARDAALDPANMADLAPRTVTPEPGAKRDAVLDLLRTAMQDPLPAPPAG